MDLIPVLKTTEMVSNWVGKNTATLRRKLAPYLYLPKDHTTYYHYEGSLTTPECQESVWWYIMTEKLKISQAQVIVKSSRVIRKRYMNLSILYYVNWTNSANELYFAYR